MKLTEWKLRCPYGKWTCADGREVIFNRSYWPILERRPGEPAKPANSGEWVKWVAQDFYFNDWTSPWSRNRKGSADTRKRCNAVLIAWGFPPLPKLPKPEAAGRVKILSSSAFVARPVPPRRNPYQICE